MHVSDIFKILADYIAFVCDLMAGRGMEAYSRKGAVDPQIVAYCVAGVALAYLLSTAKKVPGYETLDGRAQAKVPRSLLRRMSGAFPSKQTSADMLLFVILLIPGSALMHPLLAMVNGWLGGGEIGGVKDTINAGLAYAAIWHPANALITRIRSALEAGIKGGDVRPAVGRILWWAVAIGPMAFIYYFAYALASVHSQATGHMLLVSVISVILFCAGLLLAILIVGRFEDDDEDESETGGPANVG